MARILVAGEQVTGTGVDVKGFDSFAVNADKEDGQTLVDALAGGGHEVAWMRTNHVARHFPETIEAMRAYDVVILSDVGSNTLLLHPDMLANCNRHPNRLKLLADYVRQGGGLVMVGGWMSFAGIDGKARYHGSPLEEALPVTCLPYDDRQERPEGVVPAVLRADHPVLAGVPADWPFFLGYNRVAPKAGAETVLAFGPDPLLSVWIHGKGRAAAFTSDCAPHWGPPGFLDWAGYPVFWNALVCWLSGGE
jgi:uncharacterized membrane protein